MVGQGYVLFQVGVARTFRGPHETNTELEHGYNGYNGFGRIGTPLGFRNKGNVFGSFQKSVLSVSSVVSVFYRRRSRRWCSPENPQKLPARTNPPPPHLNSLENSIHIKCYVFRRRLMPHSRLLQAQACTHIFFLAAISRPPPTTPQSPARWQAGGKGKEGQTRFSPVSEQAAILFPT